MIEALKIFLTRLNFSVEDEEDEKLEKNIETIFNSLQLNKTLTLQEIQNYFLQSYHLVKKYIKYQQQPSFSPRSITKFDESFKSDFDDCFKTLGDSLINKEALFIMLEQTCLQMFQRVLLAEISNKYEDIVFKYYCLKQQKLDSSIAKFKGNCKTDNLFEQQLKKLKKDQEKEYEFIQNMRGIQSYIDSEEFRNKEYMQYTSQSIKYDDENQPPVLPSFFLNFNMTESLKGIKQVESSQRNRLASETIFTEKVVPKNENQMLNSVRGVKEVQGTPYLPISLISNSRTNHSLFLQKLLECDRVIATSYSDEQNNICEGDILGFLDRKDQNKTMILTTPGLDDIPSLQKLESEALNVSQLNMRIKDFQKQFGHKQQYPNLLQEQKQETTLFLNVIQQIKKSIVCQFLLNQSNTVYVILQDVEQDFVLYQQIKLICSSFLHDKNKKIIFIHYYPNIKEVRCESAERQFKKIQKRYNLIDSTSDFSNETFTRFTEKEEQNNNQQNKSVISSKTVFLHYMLFGDFESKYNQKLFQQIKKDIDSSTSPEIIPNQIEKYLKSQIFNCLDIYFEVYESQLQFKEQPLQNKQQNPNIKFKEWKDLVMYPYSFLTPNMVIGEVQSEN